MRKATLLLMALALLAFAAPAMSASFWSETFTYANGGLVAVSGGNWATHSGTGTDVQVTGGVANLDMLNAPDDNRTFPAQSATAKTYACMQVTVPTQAAAIVATYFAHFKDTGTLNFAGRLAVMPPAGSSGFRFGIGATTTTFVPWGTDLNFGQTYTVAIMYDAAAGSAKLWVDPLTEASTSVSSLGGTTGFLLSAFAFRQSTNGNFKAMVDNIQVGDAFLSLCPSPTPTNSSTWGRMKTLYR